MLLHESYMFATGCFELALSSDQGDIRVVAALTMQWRGTLP
jgi:hypothetical protein